MVIKHGTVTLKQPNVLRKNVDQAATDTIVLIETNI